MSCSARLFMIGMTLLFDIGVILLGLRASALPPALKLLFALLPWMILAGCLVRWPKARPTTQAWVGVLLLLVLFALLAGILTSL